MKLTERIEALAALVEFGKETQAEFTEGDIIEAYYSEGFRKRNFPKSFNGEVVEDTGYLLKVKWNNEERERIYTFSGERGVYNDSKGERAIFYQIGSEQTELPIPPPGLHLKRLAIDQTFRDAQHEVARLYNGGHDVSTALFAKYNRRPPEQINDHFFVGNHFPLNDPSRTLKKVTLSQSDERVTNLVQIMRRMMRLYGHDPKMVDHPGFNAIVRKYTGIKNIPQHVDLRHIFDEPVFGLVLHNTSTQKYNGLKFTNGSHQYTLQEKTGSSLFFEGQTRYNWLHGFQQTDPDAVRITVTFRWFSQEALQFRPAEAGVFDFIVVKQ